MIGFGVGMCLSRLLAFAAGFVQHPGKKRVSIIHSMWILFTFMTVLFHWWYYIDPDVEYEYSSSYYVFSVISVSCLYFICVTLTPENIDEYKDLYHYFLSRRIWFFSLFAFYGILEEAVHYAYSIDDISIDSYLHEMIYLFVFLSVLFVAVFVKSKKIQASIVLFFVFLSILVFVI